MTKKFIVEQTKNLKTEKKKLEARLSTFAKESKKVKGGWDVVKPIFNGGHLEEEADEVEEFDTLLALENTLEKELKKVDIALEKIKKGKYGVCGKCQKPIPQGRLEVYPQAEYCTKCQTP